MAWFAETKSLPGVTGIGPPGAGGGACCDDLAPGIAPVGSQVDYPVGRGNDIKLVFDDHDRMAQIAQFAEDFKQVFDIGEVQAGGRLVEDIECPAGRGPAELGGQLDSLCFAPEERGARLAQAQVSEPDIVKHIKSLQHAGHSLKERSALIDTHGERVADRFCL